VRVARFEHRAGLRVSRVMAPPHGACSEPLARELPAFGFDALCASRPSPWLAGPPEDDVLATWHRADIVAGGVPVLPRMPFQTADDELRLRAFLRQPIILYGHHGDVRDGLELLEAEAARVRNVGTAAWVPLDDIATSSYDLWIEGSGRGRVIVHTRRVLVRTPPGVAELVLEARAAREGDRILVDGQPLEGSVIRVEAEGTVEIRVARDEWPESARMSTGLRPVPFLRRAVTEARDRLQPIVAPARV
jgi:hypothetical protein